MNHLTELAAKDQSATDYLQGKPLWVQFVIGVGLLVLAVVMKKADDKYDNGKDEDDGSGTGFLNIGAFFIGVFGLIALWVAVF